MRKKKKNLFNRWNVFNFFLSFNPNYAFIIHVLSSKKFLSLTLTRTCIFYCSLLHYLAAKCDLIDLKPFIVFIYFTTMNMHVFLLHKYINFEGRGHAQTLMWVLVNKWICTLYYLFKIWKISTWKCSWGFR